MLTNCLEAPGQVFFFYWKDYQGFAQQYIFIRKKNIAPGQVGPWC